MDPWVALGVFFLLDFGVQWTCCAVSVALKTEIFFDVVGSCTFLLGAFFSLGSGGHFLQRQVLATTLVAVWATRLGTFLFMRILQAGKDSRFDAVRDSPSWLLTFWTIQGVWVYMVLLPVVLLNVSSEKSPWWQPSDLAGLCLWTVGFLVEIVADYQKYFFRLDEGNKDKWIDSGLWSLCRHPNYFGEMVIWWGMYLLCFAGLPSPALRLLGLSSPLFTMYALVNMSGVPLLERAAEKKWGANPEYQAYKKRTPCVVPSLVPRRKTHAH